ncbi:hypothetical protein [Nocardioides jensenii]|uniref:hypothetical protein n=1 Tax=Nocardioides jensenii TaxID=1843 RepID=UPI00082CE2F7|nr:hypothetical protein [Nocardioides jensenii]
MASTDVSALAERLGTSVDELAAFSACSPDEVAHLDMLVAAVFAAEAEAVESGLRATLTAVPRPLRGRAKALLFPGEDA